MWTCLENPKTLQRHDFQTLLNKQTCEDLPLTKEKKSNTPRGLECVSVRWFVAQGGKSRKHLRLCTATAKKEGFTKGGSTAASGGRLQQIAPQFYQGLTCWKTRVSQIELSWVSANIEIRAWITNKMRFVRTLDAADAPAGSLMWERWGQVKQLKACYGECGKWNVTACR